MTLLEAMGTGIPIIATNVGGIPDILENNKEAILVSNDCKDIVEALNKLAKDESLREKLGKNAKEKSKNFSSNCMAKKYLEIYKNNF